MPVFGWFHDGRAPVRRQITEAADYARQLGMGIVMDLDVRLARRAFEMAHPDELQQMLRIRETTLGATGDVALSITADTPSDHYTYRALPYVSRAGRLLRVYAYKRGPEGIDPVPLRWKPGAT